MSPRIDSSASRAAQLNAALRRAAEQRQRALEAELQRLKQQAAEKPSDTRVVDRIENTERQLQWLNQGFSSLTTSGAAPAGNVRSQAELREIGKAAQDRLKDIDRQIQSYAGFGGPDAMAANALRQERSVLVGAGATPGADPLIVGASLVAELSVRQRGGEHDASVQALQGLAGDGVRRSTTIEPGTRYTLQRGDTLGEIAHELAAKGVPGRPEEIVNQILAANQGNTAIATRDLIYAGREIDLPGVDRRQELEQEIVETAMSAPVEGAPLEPSTVNGRPVGQPTSCPTTNPADAPAETASGYTLAQADDDARALYEATRGGLTGWGTDEKAIFQTLTGKTADDVALIRRSFKDQYGKDLDEVLSDELSGADQDHARALLEGSENQSGVDAVRIKAELDGRFGDESEILKIIEKAAPEDRRAIAEAYAKRNGGPEGAEAEAFFLEALEEDLNEDEMARARALMSAGAAESPEEALRLESEAAAGRLKDAVDGMGTDEDAIKEVLAGKSAREVRAIQDAYQRLYGDNLGDRLQKEAAGRGEHDLFARYLNPVAEGDAEGQAIASAERIKDAVDGGTFGFGTDEAALREEFAGKTQEEVDAIAEQYGRKYGDLPAGSTPEEYRNVLRQKLIKEASSEGQEDVFLRHLNPARQGDAQVGAEVAAEQLKDAVDGWGTNEDGIRKVLEGRSKAEIDAIAAAYEAKYGGNLRSRLTDELGGREELELVDHAFDLGAVDASDPNAAAERIRRMREKHEAEQGFGTWLTSAVQTVTKGGTDETDEHRYQQHLAEAEAALQRGDAVSADRRTGFAEGDLESLQSSKDEAAEYSAEIAAISAAAVVTVATAGTAAPVVVAAYGATAGAVARAGAYTAVQGGSADQGDVARHAALGAVTGATFGLTPGAGSSVRLVGGRSVGGTREVLTQGGAGAAARSGTFASDAAGWARLGAISGGADGAVRTATDDATWREEGGIFRIVGGTLRGAVIGAGVGGAVGGTTGSLRRFHASRPHATITRSADAASDSAGGAAQGLSPEHMAAWERFKGAFNDFRSQQEWRISPKRLVDREFRNARTVEDLNARLAFFQEKIKSSPRISADDLAKLYKEELPRLAASEIITAASLAELKLRMKRTLQNIGATDATPTTEAELKRAAEEHAVAIVRSELGEAADLPALQAARTSLLREAEGDEAIVAHVEALYRAEVTDRAALDFGAAQTPQELSAALAVYRPFIAEDPVLGADVADQYEAAVMRNVARDFDALNRSFFNDTAPMPQRLEQGLTELQKTWEGYVAAAAEGEDPLTEELSVAYRQAFLGRVERVVQESVDSQLPALFSVIRANGAFPNEVAILQANSSPRMPRSPRVDTGPSFDEIVRNRR